MTATTTFNWCIVNLERETADGFVFGVHYAVEAADGTYTAGAYGSIALDRPDGTLIPFDDITPALMVSWVKDRLTEERLAEIEASLQAQLDEQHQPTTASGLPWSAN